MSDGTKISWTNETWNPIVGCSLASPGCTNCYAMNMAWRQEHGFKTPHYAGTTKKVNGNAVWTGKIAMAPDSTLTKPLKRRKPTMYFVNSMSDLFHEDVPDEWIDRVFAVMALCPQHTFQVLTKRADRMRNYLSSGRATAVGMAALELVCQSLAENEKSRVGSGIILTGDIAHLKDWPLPNVWLGVSAEDQRRADERIPVLLDTPAAVRFVSIEPQLEHIDLSPYLGYNPLHETYKEGRRKGLSSHSEWRDDDRRSGPDMADSKARMGQVESEGSAEYIVALESEIKALRVITETNRDQRTALSAENERLRKIIEGRCSCQSFGLVHHHDCIAAELSVNAGEKS